MRGRLANLMGTIVALGCAASPPSLPAGADTNADAGSTGDASTTTGTTVVTTADGTDADTDATMTAVGSSGDPGTSTGTVVGSSSGGAAGTTDSSSGDTPPPMTPYPPCDQCQPGQACNMLVDPADGSVCADPCSDDADCPNGPTGTATPWCGSISDHCVLLCGRGRGTCPDGMVCVPAAAVEACVWPA